MRRPFLTAGLLALSLAATLPSSADDAQELYAKGRWAEAARAFEEQLSSKRDAPTLIALADCYARLDQLDRAIPRYEEALRLDPRATDAARNLGRALYRAGRYRESASALARGVEGHATADELRLLASALALADDAMGAVVALERALIAAPDDARVRRDLGSAYVRAGRAADGARSLRTAIAKDPGALDTWVLLGHALAAAGDRDEAMVALDVAARLGVADRPALDLLADLQLDANEPAGAAATYEAALAAARPRDPETLERLAVARLRSGDAARALAALDEVLSLDATAGRPLRSSALLWRSDALAALGRASEARALLEALVRECGRAGGRESDRVREAARERLARLR